MKLRLETTNAKFNDTSASLCLDDKSNAITIRCPNAPAVAEQIARAVNRDAMFDALVAALSPFRSTEMGGKLVYMIDNREDRAEETQTQLSRMISMIDVILDAAEMSDDVEAADDDVHIGPGQVIAA